MRNTIPLIIFSFAVLLGACKKDYTCTCTARVSFGGSPLKYSIEDKTKNQAKQACDDYEKQNVPGGGLNCSLQ